MLIRCALLALLAAGGVGPVCRADVGDPQLRTDHPWYPGELACSTFDRLAATQAEVFQRVVGRAPQTDEEKALAAWLWRNTHYWHGQEGSEDLWGTGFEQGGNSTTREYWTGLFAHGFALCGTTHAQWTAELNALLGHNRSRVVGTAGHNSMEVFLKGGPYGEGRWALLDHDLSTVIYDRQGEFLLSIADVQRDYQTLTDPNFSRQKQHGWPVCGLHPGDGAAFAEYKTVEYLAGYSGAPPMVHLRRGESLRRYLQPGLEDGKTFVFWGRNYNTQGVPGPERARTWVNQPDKLYGSQQGSGYHAGQARYGNAVYDYRPDFQSDDYREGVAAEDGSQITFRFQSPYIIAATPPDDGPWSIYDAGCRNGLVVQGQADCQVAVSVDRGGHWIDCGRLNGSLDLTDHAKGHRQYWLRFSSPDAKADVRQRLRGAALRIQTVCQANTSIMPRLRDGETSMELLASGRAVVSAGPNLPQARPHLIAGDFDTPKITMRLAPPAGQPVVAIHAAAHVHSSNPPDPTITYAIDYSTDQGKSWRPLVEDWRITLPGDQPKDFWSQSFCWGGLELPEPTDQPVQVRFRNSGGKRYARAEVHLVYQVPSQDATEVTFAWSNEAGEQTASHVFDAATGTPATWELDAGAEPRTHWVQYRPVPRNQP